MYIYKMFSTFYKNYQEKPTMILFLITFTPPIATWIIKPMVKLLNTGKKK